MSKCLDSLITNHLAKTFPAAQIEIRIGGEIAYSQAFGYLDPETKSRFTNHESRFDLASVSKLFTVTAFMKLVEESRVGLDQPVCEILPTFSGERPIVPYPDPLRPGEFVEIVSADDKRVDASQITFRQLLAHNSGLPAWLPLYKHNLEHLHRTQVQVSPELMRTSVLNSPFSYPTSTRVVYSDVGLLLLGFALEKIGGKSLDHIVRERVTAPLGLESVRYGPIECDNVAPTEFYERHGRRMCGEVHDENAWGLGGVAGHAGLFGTAHGVATLGEMYRRGGDPLLKRETVAEMTRQQAQDGAVRRGLGFALWSPDPASASNPLSEKSFGHTGFTGTSLFVDPVRELVVACLTNRVYYGRENAAALGAFRVALHGAVIEAIEEADAQLPITNYQLPITNLELVIGIDGGGSRTRARLANSRGELLGGGDAGSCNPQTHGASVAQREILNAIERAFENAGIEKQIVAAACLGIGGIDRAEEREAFASWAREAIANRVEVMNDGRIVIAAGTPDNWGIALIAGTGSIAYGKSRDEKFARAGGWGHLLGDEGSAFDLARHALRAATQAVDGRGERTILGDKIKEYWKLAELSELIPRVYRSDLKPADLAQIAPLVIRAAEENDAVAKQLVEQAGESLAISVIAVARALNFTLEKIPLALTGGLLLGAESLRIQLTKALQSRGYEFSRIELVHEPVVGAVRIAMEMLR